MVDRNKTNEKFRKHETLDTGRMIDKMLGVTIQCDACGGEGGYIIDGDWVFCKKCKGAGSYPE